jgi:hypothetical protein
MSWNHIKAPLALVLLLVCVVSVHAAVRQFSEDFERPAADWAFVGGAGLDHGKGLAHTGQGNAWVRNTTGWNAVQRWMGVNPRSHCVVVAWLRLSPGLTNGWMSVRNDKENRADGNFDVIKEIKLVGPGPANPGHAGYNMYTFEFDSGVNSRVLFYVGLHGNGKDSWIQIDDISVSSLTPK